jgi:hypothetical protein
MSETDPYTWRAGDQMSNEVHEVNKGRRDEGKLTGI